MSTTISEFETHSVSPEKTYGIATDQPNEWPNNWILDAKSAFQKLFRLSSNWDGEGSTSPDGRVLRNAWILLDALSRADCPRPIDISPSRNGGLQIEWERGPRYFEVEFDPDTSQVHCFSSDELEGHEEEYDLPFSEIFGPVLEAAKKTCS